MHELGAAIRLEALYNMYLSNYMPRKGCSNYPDSQSERQWFAGIWREAPQDTESRQ